MTPKLLDIIRNRRSVKEYLPREISKDIIIQILEAARWAPSAHNAQPWRFIIVVERVLKRRLAEAMAEKWIRDMVRDNIPSETRETS